MKDWKRRIILSGCILFVVFGFSGVLSLNFTIEGFWEAGSIINFEIEYEEDLPGSIVDYESETDGAYEYNGTISDGNMIFNIKLTTRPQEFLLAQGSTTLSPFQYLPIFYPFSKGDELEFNFAVSNGTIDFFVFNQSQYNSWLEQNQSIQAIEVVYTEIGASGTVTFTTTNFYYCVWYNDPNNNDNSVTLQLQLDVKTIAKSIEEYTEIDPLTLESTDGENIDDFGMDTSDWTIDDEVSIEINNEEVEFKINKEDEVSILYNNKEKEIPCWILEIENHERTFVDEVFYSTLSDITIWKSKYSGITLKSDVDTTFYDNNDEMLTTSSTKFEVTSTEGVLLMSKSSRIVFPLIPPMIALFAAFLLKRKRIV